MGFDVDPERIESLHEEMQELISEASDQENTVEEDLNTVEDKVEFLQENVDPYISGEKLEKIYNLFIDVCHHLIKDIRAEHEINQELNRLEEDERNYVKLMNRIQSEDLPEDVRSRVQSYIGTVSRDEIESAISQDRKIERREASEIHELIKSLTDVSEDLNYNLKKDGKKPLRGEATRAWAQLTDLDQELVDYR